MKLAVVAGEASGDLHASEVVRELEKLDPSLVLFGIGGDLLAAEGTELVHHAAEMGIVGFFNVLRHLPRFRRIFADLIARIEKERPDAVFLIDYPGFNLRVAKRCKELGLKVVYYISPQIWAWRQGRVRHIAKYVDRMIVVFPFEETFYRNHGVPVTYVGHPLVEQLAEVKRPPRRETLRIALLPGSRKAEVTSLLPAMLDAVAILRKDRAVDAYIIQAPTIDHDELASLVRANGTDVPILPHDRGEGVAAADISLSASGTATLESAVLGTPVVVMYRLSRLNYWLGRMVVNLPYFSLVNIVAGKKIVPELLQHDVNGARIADEVRRMIEPAAYATLVEELARVREALGSPGASSRAAAEIHEMVRR
ncbi:MAG TPA: lipid-A-disaccharide synthase [Thermoanaerobaculia bacterium]|nr:lipid-A-disaccharide synthase [Thermoanaerobaculia bacterium]